MKKITPLILFCLLNSYIINAQTVSIPDANFEQALIDLNIDSDQTINGQVLLGDVDFITELNISNKNITSLEGIKYFYDLEILNCSQNNISDMSWATSLANLETLTCSYNNITILDLENASALIDLDCRNNQITNINISDSGNLETLNCRSNALTNLNISNNTNLQSLFCQQNNLTSLNLSNNPNLQTVSCFSNSLSSINLNGATGLESLSCANNNLTSINTSNNSNLKSINCSANSLTTIDVSQNTLLNTFICISNSTLTDIDLSQNSNLTYIKVEDNNLSSLNVQNGNNSNVGFSFYATNNPNLLCIKVDNVAYSETNWINIDLQTEFSLSCETIAIPDSNFEQRLISLGVDNNGLNGNILVSEALAASSLNLANQNISDLTGIEGFTNLTNLICNNNQLTTIDLSANTLLETLNIQDNSLTALNINQNTALKELNCSINNLTSLSTTQNIALEKLLCSSNQLTSINISQSTSLIELRCQSNQLSSLDTSQNLLLSEIYCHGNQITSLDFSANTALTEMYCLSNSLSSLNIKNGNNTNITIFNAETNPLLTCIQVDDASYATTNWTDVDIQVVFSENCSAPQSVSIPDSNFEQRLIYDGIDTNGLNGNILQSDANAVNGILNLSNANISDLTGIEAFINATHLTCSNNQLTSIDISQNPNIISLNAGNNQLTSIDLSQNLNLEALFCNDNLISSIDLSLHSNLINLDCKNNTLTNLDIKNGNNSNIYTFDATGNINLNCINVDNAAYSTTNWPNIDAHTSFSENCSLSLDDLTFSNIKLYPNPATDRVFLNTSSQLKIDEAIFTDISGKIVLQTEVSDNSISIERLTSGLYFIKLKSDDRSVIKKLVVQ